jgi:hypothetical protein
MPRTSGKKGCQSDSIGNVVRLHVVNRPNNKFLYFATKYYHQHTHLACKAVHAVETFAVPFTQFGVFENEIVVQPHPDEALHKQLHKSAEGKTEKFCFRIFGSILRNVTPNRMDRVSLVFFLLVE